MRGYHLKVALLSFGVLLGYGSAFARYQAGYGLFGHPGWHHAHGHHAHQHCDDDWEGDHADVHSKTP